MAVFGRTDKVKSIDGESRVIVYLENICWNSWGCFSKEIVVTSHKLAFATYCLSSR